MTVIGFNSVLYETSSGVFLLKEFRHSFKRFTKQNTVLIQLYHMICDIILCPQIQIKTC